MGHKKVCTACRLSFNRPDDFGIDRTYPCPQCGASMLLLPHRFKAPAKTDAKKWEVVKFLIENGFPYQHIYKTENGKRTDEYADFPETLSGAREFIELYKNQAYNK